MHAAKSAFPGPFPGTVQVSGDVESSVATEEASPGTVQVSCSGTVQVSGDVKTMCATEVSVARSKSM